MKPYRGEYMANYSITSGKLEPIKENPFKLEKRGLTEWLQTIVQTEQEIGRATFTSSYCEFSQSHSNKKMLRCWIS